MNMEGSEEWDRRADITIATIRSTAKRESAMRILGYLNNNSDGGTIQEISDGLDMDWGTAKPNLTKLTECGFVELVKDDMDARCRYFKIASKKAVEKALELYRIRQVKMKKKEQERKVNPEKETEESKPERKSEAEEVF